MSVYHSNPYHAVKPTQTGDRSHRWPNWFASGACVYYMLSAATLPFANKVWIGEIPILGLFQIPKAFLKSVIHEMLLNLVHRLGWSAGSASPDYGMIHPWAMIFMRSLPALVLISVLLYFRTRRHSAVYLIAVVTCTTNDAMITLLFDASSSLKHL